MKETNKLFFSNILSRLEEDLAKRIPNAIRYIATTEDEKIWLKSLRIKYSFRISRDTFALLVYLEHKDYLCLINIGTVDGKLSPCMSDVPVNAGLITVLGSEGYLTPKFDHVRQLQIYENVMYDTSEIVGYQGHQWNEIMDWFPSVHCYKLNLEEEDADIRENLNLFYKVLCQKNN